MKNTQIFEFKRTSSYYNQPTSVISVKTDAESLSEVLEEFTSFLRASGFHFDGELQIVENDLTQDDDFEGCNDRNFI